MPLFFLFIKNLVIFSESNHFPLENQIIIFNEYINKEIPNYTNKNLIIKESFYYLDLINKVEIENKKEIYNLIFNYCLKQLHLIDIPFDTLHNVITSIKRYENIEFRLINILELIEKTILKEGKNMNPVVIYDLISKYFFYSNYFTNSNYEAKKNLFEVFLDKIRNANEISKVSILLLQKLVDKQIPQEFRSELLKLLLNNIEVNFEEISIYNFSIVKLLIILIEIKSEYENDNKIKEKIEILLNKITTNLNLQNLWKGLKILNEGKQITISDNTLHFIYEVYSKNIQIKNHQNYEENMILFFYLLLDSHSNISHKIIEKILANVSYEKIQFSFEKTHEIVRLMIKKKINAPCLIKLYETQLRKKILVEKNIINDEISDVLFNLNLKI